MTTGPGERVCVVGGGVVGLSVAHELAQRGVPVVLVARESAADTVSAVAGGLWFPYRVDGAADGERLLERSLRRFEEVAAAEPSAGVDLREGLVVERTAEPDRAWTRVVTEHREVAERDLPAGASGAVRTRLPLVTMPVYLAWLTGQVRRAGVEMRTAEVDSPHAAAELTGAGTVVVAAGGGSGRILGDDASVVPVRGQVVRLRNPGLREWIVDDDHPDGLTYVLPRRTDVVCGGTAEEGLTDLHCDPETEAAILRRAVELVPGLTGAEVIGRSAGLRPTRPTLRVGPVAAEGSRLRVYACYGHGGAGVTLSWGSAERVAELIVRAARPRRDRS
ncbi:FAD-dependent oxidoreductase [Nocardioides sambongensis]|uniref:FAD-dependent oxidoreductase n=1 Tax=Nocardioides sambongensis TaxID=2589074 RepID=UPI001128EFD8|nr:FAD-dependent oxidoreductase [Nocardioides sambongensis]